MSALSRRRFLGGLGASLAGAAVLPSAGLSGIGELPTLEASGAYVGYSLADVVHFDELVNGLIDNVITMNRAFEAIPFDGERRT